jgi:Ca2+/Na+ antiporter
MDSVTLLFSTMFYVYATNDWKILHSCFLIILFYCLIVFCYLPESPKFLSEKQDYFSAASAYNRIIAFNGGTDGKDFVKMDELIPDGQEPDQLYEKDGE